MSSCLSLKNLARPDRVDEGNTPPVGGGNEDLTTTAWKSIGRSLVSALLLTVIIGSSAAHAERLNQPGRIWARPNRSVPVEQRRFVQTAPLAAPVPMAPNGAQAAPPAFQSRAPMATTRRTPGDAAQWARQTNGGGRVLSVYPSPNGYRVKMLKNGEVRFVEVPN